MANKTLRVDYDDQLDGVVEKMNKILRPELGVEFVDDGETHDGYMIYKMQLFWENPKEHPLTEDEIKLLIEGRAMDSFQAFRDRTKLSFRDSKMIVDYWHEKLCPDTYGK